MVMVIRGWNSPERCVWKSTFPSHNNSRQSYPHDSPSSHRFQVHLFANQVHINGFGELLWVTSLCSVHVRLKFSYFFVINVFCKCALILDLFIFAAISATRPRADVAYCIQALARRLSKTSNWAVALKTLIVIHRALREVDPTFQEELLSYGTKTLFNLSNFKDDSSPKAWDYSSWIRTYALYLEERLNCFHILKYDVETERIVRLLLKCYFLTFSSYESRKHQMLLSVVQRTRDLDTPELFGQLSALQQLLYRVLG
ncbi:hypothetical protein CTI12_AA031350 [Artemisia annua]|uniref:ENTH domain-containing protein n=1 Tax=Artemisia annua TaxID=35608 RepID=A0A2U1QA80_ARTAN|nr:hypothetical protein CTI12_AA031350 [Artemisia annua]